MPTPTEIKKQYRKDVRAGRTWDEMIQRGQKKRKCEKLYHVTTPECVDSILKDGLIVQIGENARLNGAEDPYVYLCYEKDVPFWMILLQRSVILEVTGFKGAMESFQYDGYAELMALDSIPAKHIRVSDWKPDLAKAMEHLCISYVFLLSSLCEDIVDYYEYGYSCDKEYRNHLMENIWSVTLTLQRLDFTTVDPEELKQAIRDSKDGSYGFVGRHQNNYKDEDSYIWKKIASEKTDLLYPYAKELSQTIQEKFPDFLYGTVIREKKNG